MTISDHTTERRPHSKGCEYRRALVDTDKEASHAVLSSKKGMAALAVPVKSEARTDASVAGCSANNANAGRTLNANNSATNSNDNYALGFAGMKAEKYRKGTPTSRPTRSKNEMMDNRIANGGYGPRDYDFTSLPFWGDDKTKAESETTTATHTCEGVNMEDPIWQKLEKANKRRNLKGLSEFYENMTIAVFAVRRCCKDKDTAKKREYYDRADVVAAWMKRQIKRGTYHVIGYQLRDIPPRFKTGKHRAAKVFTLFDRCMQMFVLTIIEGKLRNKVLRNNYSNIEGRGIYCNDKRYCMLNAIRTATIKYPSDVVLLTDIQKFYDSVGWKVMCGVIFETVKDKTTRWLILVTLQAAGTLPIGCCFSPLFADILMNDYDMHILTKFKTDFFAAFGDNRIIFTDKQTAVQIQTFTKSYYEGRYGVTLKNDYQIRPASIKFSFCKKQFERGFVRERAEIRRRSIRVAEHPQSLAGYIGMYQKTDSKHLLYLITHHLNFLKMKNNKGMDISPFAGKDADISTFVDERICITNYAKINNGKESEYYYHLQYVSKKSGIMEVYHSKTGCFEIKQAGDLWMRENKQPPIYVTVRRIGKSIYFEEYHTTNKEACEKLVEKFNINL